MCIMNADYYSLGRVDTILDQPPVTQCSWRLCQTVVGIWQVVKLEQEQVDLGRRECAGEISTGWGAQSTHLQLANVCFLTKHRTVKLFPR